jgi:hypothetical protein
LEAIDIFNKTSKVILCLVDRRAPCRHGISLSGTNFAQGASFSKHGPTCNHNPEPSNATSGTGRDRRYGTAAAGA